LTQKKSIDKSTESPTPSIPPQEPAGKLPSPTAAPGKHGKQEPSLSVWKTFTLCEVKNHHLFVWSTISMIFYGPWLPGFNSEL
jgi:hypothetical protein